ncbi:uncharacterized protein LOC132325688 [Haemorhous mexicanus]|uniref:uncharacterized protein LOC132325688 n=1 Tax=Haemorhous mexicanus TaxID=30427 RepID=UPI0028BD6407|nr:uncharacterized protein LOC132325688 [Haemorhous mexicanus]
MGEAWQLVHCPCATLRASPSLPAPQAQHGISREGRLCRGGSRSSACVSEPAAASRSRTQGLHTPVYRRMMREQKSCNGIAVPCTENSQGGEARPSGAVRLRPDWEHQGNTSTCQEQLVKMAQKQGQGCSEKFGASIQLPDMRGAAAQERIFVGQPDVLLPPTEALRWSRVCIPVYCSRGSREISSAISGTEPWKQDSTKTERVRRCGVQWRTWQEHPTHTCTSFAFCLD